MRKLDKFQQFVKDGEYQPNLSITKAQEFLKLLTGDLDEGYEHIKSDLCGMVDTGDFIDAYAVDECMEDVINKHVKIKINACIEEALEEIEDIEAVNAMEVEPEDCMDIHHRQSELNQ